MVGIPGSLSAISLQTEEITFGGSLPVAGVLERRRVKFAFWRDDVSSRSDASDSTLVVIPNWITKLRRVTAVSR
jgi:hypothetical protein